MNNYCLELLKNKIVKNLKKKKLKKYMITY